jgi:hypothetical protein
MPVVYDVDPRRYRGSAGRPRNLSPYDPARRYAGMGPNDPPQPPPRAPPPSRPEDLAALDFDYGNNEEGDDGGGKVAASAASGRPHRSHPNASSPATTRRGSSGDGRRHHDRERTISSLAVATADSPPSANLKVGSPSGRGRPNHASASAAAASASSDQSPRSARIAEYAAALEAEAAARSGRGSILDRRGVPGGRHSERASAALAAAQANLIRRRNPLQGKLQQAQESAARYKAEAERLQKEVAVLKEKIEPEREARRLAEERADQLERDCQLAIQRHLSQMQTLVEASRAEAGAFRTELDDLRRHVDGELQPELDRKVQEVARLQESHNGVVQMLQDNQRNLETENARLHNLLEAKDTTVQDHEQHVSDLLVENQKLVEDNHRLVDDNRTLVDKNQALVDKNQALVEENRRLAANLAARHEEANGSSVAGSDAQESDDEEDDEDDDGDDDDEDPYQKASGNSSQRGHTTSPPRPVGRRGVARSAVASSSSTGKHRARRAVSRELQDLQRSNEHYGEWFYRTRQDSTSVVNAGVSIGTSTSTRTAAHRTATGTSYRGGSDSRTKASSADIQVGRQSSSSPHAASIGRSTSGGEPGFVLRSAQRSGGPRGAAAAAGAPFRKVAPPGPRRQGPVGGVLARLTSSGTTGATYAPSFAQGSHRNHQHQHQHVPNEQQHRTSSRPRGSSAVSSAMTMMMSSLAPSSSSLATSSSMPLRSRHGAGGPSRHSVAVRRGDDEDDGDEHADPLPRRGKGGSSHHRATTASAARSKPAATASASTTSSRKRGLRRFVSDGFPTLGRLFGGGDDDNDEEAAAAATESAPAPSARYPPKKKRRTSRIVPRNADAGKGGSDDDDDPHY